MMNHPESTNDAQAPPAPPGRGRRAAFGPAIAVGVATLLAYATDLRELARTWSTEPDYTHGFLVIPVAAWIFWQERPTGAAAANVAPSRLGWLAVAAILVARAFLYERGEYWLETATIVPAVGALIVSMGGLPLLRRTWPAVAFLTLMLTVPGPSTTRSPCPCNAWPRSSPARRCGSSASGS